MKKLYRVVIEELAEEYNQVEYHEIYRTRDYFDIKELIKSIKETKNEGDSNSESNTTVSGLR